MASMDIAQLPEDTDPFAPAAETQPEGPAKTASSLGAMLAPLRPVVDAMSGVAGVAKGTFDFFFGSMLGDAAQDPEAQEVIDKVTEPIPNQDIIYEQLAHNLAYGKYDVAQLAAWGYGPPKVIVPLDPLTGMFVVSVEPLKNADAAKMKEIHGEGVELRPVIAFRGSTDAVDWADDMSPEGIGAMHFAAHKAQIAKALAKYEGGMAPDVTGHSLGGALAQMAATVGAVNRVVTFQAPGIPAEMAAQIGEDVQATHHRAAGDPVAWAGEEHAEGDAFIYNQTRWGEYNPHTAFLLDGLNASRGGVVPGIADGSVFTGSDYTMDPENPGNAIDPAKLAAYEAQEDLTWVSKDAQDMNRDGETDGFELAVDSGRGAASELVRKGIGEALRIGDDLGLDATRRFADVANAGTSKGAAMSTSGADMELYLSTWDRIEPRIPLTDPDLLAAEIDAAGFEDPRWAEQMKSQVYMMGTVDVPAGAPSYVPEPHLEYGDQG
jgi:hypothetical protein